MKKLLRLFVVLVCALCMTAAVAACGDKTESNTTTYTVTVTCPGTDATTLVLTKVKLVKADGTDATELTALSDITSPASGPRSGKVTFNVEPGTYTVKLDLPVTKYKVPETTLTPINREATIALTEGGSEKPTGKVEYKIKLALDDGSGVEGKLVQLCGGPNYACHQETTNSSGVATFSLDPDNYDVHVAQSEWPDGYSFNDNMYKVTATTTELTVKFDAVRDFKITVKYAATKDATGAAVAAQPAEGLHISLSRVVGDTFIPNSASGVTGANGVATIATANADYRVSITDCPANYSYLNRDTIIIEGGTTPTLEITLYERGSNPYVPVMIKAGESKTLSVSPKTQQHWLWFDPQGTPGVYKLESTGNLDTVVRFYEGSAGSIIYCTIDEHGREILNPPLVGPNDLGDKDPANGDYNFYKEFSISSHYTNANNIFAFLVSAQNLPDPIGNLSFTVTAARIGDVEEHDIEVTMKEAEQTVNPTTPPAGTPTLVPYADGEQHVFFNSTDNLYHYGSETGPVVYAAVSGDRYLPRTFDTCLYDAYESAAGIGFVISDGETYSYNYGEFLAAYKTKGNSDGLHVLTEEMKFFLQSYARLNHNTDHLHWTNAADNELFLFGCYYYAE